MATLKIPLNKFVSKYVKLTTSQNLSSVYLAAERRATIIISAQAANETKQIRTISFGVSAENNIFYLVKDLEIPPSDARSLITGRTVIQGIDNIDVFTPQYLVLQDTTDSTINPEISGLTVTMGLLETINVD
jgi:hypothetical protein